MATAKKAPAVDNEFDGFEFDDSVLDDIDQDSILDDGPGYPTIIWRGGSPAMRKAGGIEYHGGWFIGEDSGIDADLLTAAGWEPDSFIATNDKEIPGFSCTLAEFQVINYRRRWRAEGKAYGWNDYEKAVADVGKARGQMNVMVRVRGLEEVGPMVVTLSGNAQMAFRGDKDYRGTGVLPSAKRTIIAHANELTKKNGGKKRWPYSAFFLPVGVPFVKEAPQFTTVGSGDNTRSIVVPTLMGVPDDWKAVNLNLYFAGKPNIDAAAAAFDESKDWVAQWENIEPGTEDEDHADPVDQDETEEEVSVEGLAM